MPAFFRLIIGGRSLCSSGESGANLIFGGALPGHIGTSIVSNSRKIHGGDESDAMNATP